MNQELRKLYDEKGTVVKKMEDAARSLKEGKALTADDERQFTAWDTELSGVTAKIKILERAAQLEAETIERTGELIGKEKKTLPDNVSATLRARVWEKSKLRSGLDGMTDEERSIHAVIERDNDVFERYFRRGWNNLSAEDRALMEKRVQSTSNTAGGYTIPEGFSYEIDRQLQTISELLRFARVYRTTTGNSIPWPTNNDTSNTGELLAENSDSSSSAADLVFGVVTLAAYKFSTKMIKSSSELLQDEAIGLAQLIATQYAERIGKITNTYYTTGTGSGQPLGYTDGTNGFVQGFGSTVSNSFALKDFIDLMHSVDAAYRNSPSAAWGLHDLILAEVKKISFSSTDNRPLWMPSFREGSPDTILGKPYFINNAQASALADQAKMAYFGDWSRFVVRIVNDLSIRRLDERYAEFDQTAWVGFMRSDSRILNRNAVKYLKCT